ncbi:variable surface protein, partial [Plasmodium gonderi]
MVIDLGDDQCIKLHSKEIYASFNNGDDDCKDAHFHTYVMSLLKTVEWKNDVSNDILKALCYVYNTNNEGNFNNDDCDYLYYWLNDIIYANIIYQINSTAVIEVLEFLLKAKDGLNICYNNKYNVDQENFRDIKVIHDFSKDYDKLKEYFSNDHRFCNNDVKIYLNEYIRKYNEFKHICNQLKSKQETCKAFNNYFKGKTQEDLFEWQLRLEGRSHNYTTQNERHIRLERRKDQGENTVQTHAVVYTDNNGKNAHEDVNQQTYMNTHIHDLKHEQSLDFSFKKKTPELSAIIDISDSSSGSTSKSMLIPSLGIGISIFSIILCKFTPVGYWIKKILLGKS